MHEICIVIPCYNEELRLDKRSLFSFMKDNPTMHFCFANDGSSDGTLKLLNEIKSTNPENILVVNKQINSGKADTVREGILAANKWKEFKYFAYFDADFATPLNEAENLLLTIRSRNGKFALGSRIKRLGANVKRKRLRHIFGRIFSTFASIILKLPVYDTQCGAKLISREWIETAFEKPFISAWLFDIEIIARIRNKYGVQTLLHNTVEVPLNIWIEKGKSKITLFHLLKVPFELLRIHFKYNSFK